MMPLNFRPNWSKIQISGRKIREGLVTPSVWTGLGKNGPGKNGPSKNGPGKNGPEKTVRGIIWLVVESVKTVRSFK